MKDAWPVQAQALGGRHYRGNYIDQNFDNYSVEYTFADGTKLFMLGRCIDGCYDEFAQLFPRNQVHGVTSVRAAFPAKCRIYKGQNLANAEAASGNLPPTREESLPDRVGRPDRRHSAGQALQRGETRRRGQPGHFDGPDGRPHGPGHHLRPDSQLRPRVRPRRRQVDDGLARARCWPAPTASIPCRSRALLPNASIESPLARGPRPKVGRERGRG